MKKLTFWTLFIFLITLITFYNALWYFYGGQLFRSEQSYRTRELLSTGYKIIVYLLPACILFRTYRQQSRKIYRHSFWGPCTLLFALILWFAKTQFTLPSSVIVLMTYGYVLISNSIIEEWVFRGILFDKLRSQYSFLFSNAIQAICFGLVHLPFYIWMGKSGLSLLGAISGVICLGFRRGRVKKDTKGLFYPAVLHSVWNGVLLFL